MFIDAVNEIARDRSMSFLRPRHQKRIHDAYQAFNDETGFAKVATLAEVEAHGHSLSIPLYVKRVAAEAAEGRDDSTLAEVWAEWEQDGRTFWQQMDTLVDTLDGHVGEEVARG